MVEVEMVDIVVAVDFRVDVGVEDMIVTVEVDVRVDVIVGLIEVSERATWCWGS